MSKQQLQDIAVEGAKSAPPLSVAVAYLAGIPLQTWVTVLTGIYIAAQIVVLIRREMRDSRTINAED